MLKACCDCIAAGVREERDVYGTQLNGSSLRAPLFPGEMRENGEMFLLPRKLNVGDQINVTSVLSSNPQWVSISLITGYTQPDYNNIAGQFELQFPDDTGDEKIKVKTIVNGQTEESTADLRPTDLIPDFPSSTDFTVNIRNKGYELDFYLSESYVKSITLKHNVDDIRYLTVNGNVLKVNKLDFQFA